MQGHRIARQRLRNHRLAGRPFASPEEALRWLGASQAQEYGIAKWSLAQRASRQDDAAIEHALADGRILRTHVLRPTWHFVLPEDIRWMQALTGPRVQRMNASIYRRLELDDAVLEDRAPQARRPERDEALAELARRYFRSRGPATLRDFRWWASLRAAEAKRGVELIRSELEKIDAEGRTYWFVPPLPPARAPAPRAHLLQLFDEYVVSYAETRDIAGVPNVLATLGPTFMHPIIVDGRIAGEWRPRADGKAQRVEARLWPGLDAAERAAVEDAVRRYERFTGAVGEPA